ncbi:BamA/TamA family outer membrane protein [Solitalea canadensis]|uniref:Outer membrane protein/protective antigen OMA87 n=1 Tax=Solitalea canadensis (strain ATCC 29591 / DSM 3403 / JCM 21819 / LMG 8368 / NBRC 15130 / NCIMB 12057 / USAM 9D) TaxID=929556 RepID=H8KU13_SOLCM|nr:BamA/TamA family outer membrane protein [Solitalea canadensis]AFD06993.1 outer membrane protein/protective antigen OMA87 [Solitalea canadensis DSM 3403]
MVKLVKPDYSKYLLIVLILFISYGFTNAQSITDSSKVYPIKDIGDVLFKKKKQDTSRTARSKNSFFLAIPVIASQPATGFMFGLTGQYTFKGKKPEDKYSTINASITYTTKNQWLINVKNNVLLSNNKIFLSGDWRFYIFSQPNYGLGTDIIPKRGEDEGFEIDSIAQPMDYNYLKFHQTASWSVAENFYVGAGIHLDGYTSIKDIDLDTANQRYTAHYEYNHKYGFAPTNYYVNGVSLNLLYDSRDNQINANHGWYGNINFRINPKIGKNQYNSTVLFAEVRYFVPLSKTNLQHVFGVWAYGNFVTGGKIPYLNLPSIGWDQRSRSGKGYTQGLFRGNNLVYLETEYRFPISKNQLFSGTVFADFTTTSDKDRDLKLFKSIQPAFGVGFRILLDKATRTNLILNYAWGHKSKAFYLNAGESF